MKSELVLAVRASPDWAAMADDMAAGMTVHPSRYMPADNPHFPLDMPDHIERWNRLSGISFFACRQRLREIAQRNLASVEGTRRVRAPEVSALLQDETDSISLLFYHDDDDWFLPEMARILGGLTADLERLDALVFPFFRLATNLVTFTRGGDTFPGALGRCEPYRYRYCTNNYGLTRRALERGSAALVEHIGASEMADRLGFVDLHPDVVVSATSKSPCSAGWVRELPGDPIAFRDYVERYVARLDEVLDSSPHGWINGPLRETRALFLEVLG
ncbi:MAG TPA: hypothetical protein VE891_13700 [Allosphingosinicella sp.]|nr:hypothetical protein [Allosphingosinicella sp.]